MTDPQPETSQVPFTPVTAEALATLTPAERLAFTVASAKVARDENPGINTTAALLLTIQRLLADGAETDSAASVSDDSDPGPLASPERSGPRTGTVPSLPVVAAFDREAVREIVRSTLGHTVHPDLHCAVAERVTEVFWPLLEHAQDAAAGSHEGIRLWMLDCGELVTKHRDRAEAAESALERITAERDELASEAAVLRSRLSVAEGRHVR